MAEEPIYLRGEDVGERAQPMGGARAVRVGNLIFTTGIPGQGETARAQVESIFQRLERTLEGLGARLEGVIMFRVLLRNMGDLVLVQEVRNRYFPYEKRPVTSAFEVVQLARPEYLVEIEAVAVTGDGS